MQVILESMLDTEPNAKENIFNYKDIVRCICSFLLIIKSFLLIIDDTYHLFYNSTDNQWVIKQFLNYAFCAIYLFAGLKLIIGMKVRKLAIYLIPFIALNIFLTFKSLTINHDLFLSSGILFFLLTIYVVGEGSFTIDKYMKSK